MILVIYAVALAIILGLISGGSFRSLGAIRFRGEWLVLAGLLLQTVLPVLVPSGLLSDEGMVWVLWFLPGMFLAIALAFNWRRFGLAVAAAGVMLNLLVVGINGGMPVLVAAAAHASIAVEGIQTQLDVSWLHIPADPSTALLYLADVLPVPGPSSWRGLASLGDVLLAVGVMHAVFVGMHEEKAIS